MAKFVFRLQGVLNIKQKLEDQEKIADSLARARLNEEEAKLEALVKRREELISYKQEVMQSLNVRELNLAENAINGNALAIEDGLDGTRERKWPRIAEIDFRHGIVDPAVVNGPAAALPGCHPGEGAAQ